jgi:hypothetical protein
MPDTTRGATVAEVGVGSLVPGGWPVLTALVGVIMALFGIIVAFVHAIRKEELVPRQTVDRLEKSWSGRLEEAKASAAEWRAAWTEELKTRQIQAAQLADVLSLVRAIDETVRARGRPTRGGG